MRGKGINYDTGFSPGGRLSREDFDPATVRQEMRVIAGELGCTAVRVSGGDPERLSLAAQHAAGAGLEVWFAPFPCELPAAELTPLFAECADRAEQLRRTGASVVLVAGCELSLFASGFLPGGTLYERLDRLGTLDQELKAAFGALPGRLNGLLGETAAVVRSRFGGPVSYASGMWEPVDWAPFDIVAVDAYRDASNAATFQSELRKHLGHGKPLAVTEYGCCGYAGAADRGGMGWAIIELDGDSPRLDGDYVRDEAEQVRYLAELNAVFAAEGVDLAFWFTFAGYGLVHDAEPRRDLDLASYGLVRLLPGGPGTGHHGLGWAPKLAFRALAELGDGINQAELGRGWLERRDPVMANELDGRTAAFLIANEGVEQIELTAPWQALLAAGGTPLLLAPEVGNVQAFNHLDKADTFPVDQIVSDAHPEDYDLLVLPGGVANPDILRTVPAAVRFVRGMFEAGKPAAAICHAPWLLVEADLVRGRTLTSWPSLQTDIRNAGGTWVDTAVQVDRSGPNVLITSRKPGDLPAFCQTLIEETARQYQSA